MSGVDVERILIRRLLAMPGRWPVALPNGRGVTASQRYVLEPSGANQTSEGASVITNVDREINVRIEIPEGIDTTPADNEAKRIVDWFPKNLVLEGLVEILTPPDARPGFPVDGLWIVPVLIRGRGYF